MGYQPDNGKNPFRVWLILILLFSVISAFSQTTIQLEEQCDCQVLSGTDVNAPGSTSPTGASSGDIYINTQSGQLFFWDGDSWELTRSLNRSLKTFSLDPNTFELLLETHDGRSFKADLSALKSPEPEAVEAEDIAFDNANSSLNASNVQTAIEELEQAYGTLPRIFATGKVEGTGIAQVIYGATVERLDEGDYQITFDRALPDNRYIIQVSVLDCDGDCPGNTGESFDNPGITYYDQSPDGFKVNIGDSDNGINPKDDIDLQFMFTVITLPN